MQEFGGASGASRGGTLPGLVLLYAEPYSVLQPAFPFTRQNLVIGREPPADLVLPVSAVSRVHAEVRWEQGRFFIRDRQNARHPETNRANIRVWQRAEFIRAAAPHLRARL